MSGNGIARLAIVLCLVLGVVTQSVGQEGAKVVLFEQGHGQRFLVEKNGPLDLSELGALFRDQGFVVKTSRGEISDQLLDGVDAVVISGPFLSFSDIEAALLESFVRGGGKLLVTLHIGPPVASLVKKFGGVILPGVIHEEENTIAGQDTSFRCVGLAIHPLTRGIDSFDVYGSWGLAMEGEGMELIGRTSSRAWMDANRNQQLDGNDLVQSFGLAAAGRVGLGSLAVFGDDAIFQNKFLIGSNRSLGSNLVKWFGK